MRKWRNSQVKFEKHLLGIEEEIFVYLESNLRGGKWSTEIPSPYAIPFCLRGFSVYWLFFLYHNPFEGRSYTCFFILKIFKRKEKLQVLFINTQRPFTKIDQLFVNILPCFCLSELFESCKYVTLPVNILVYIS